MPGTGGGRSRGAVIACQCPGESRWKVVIGPRLGRPGWSRTREAGGPVVPAAMRYPSDAAVASNHR